MTKRTKDAEEPTRTPGPRSPWSLAERAASAVHGERGFAGVRALLLDASPRARGWNAVCDGFESDVLPLLSDEERVALRAALLTGSRTFDRIRLLGSLGEPADASAASLAEHADGSGTRPTDGRVVHSNSALRAALTIRDADRIAAEVTRLDANPVTAEDVRALIAATGTRLLDFVADTIVACATTRSAERLAKALGYVDSAEAALPMLRVHLDSRAHGIARVWLDDHPIAASEGLAALTGESGRRGDAARAVLRASGRT